MNQQRSRRFRTALDVETAVEKAKKAGQEIPAEEPFDSNAITPGTIFMARLSEQLKYFITKKVSEDSEWRGVEIILSGHDVPGEGEHKIMEYIRNTKAQPGYQPNVRHCLYGLDADLIMLGLLSHDPHFCLLREEVTFGPLRGKKSNELVDQKFYLMHLSLVREYLEIEFQDLREVISFEYNLERVIDDFILMAFFVGNDFLPNVPHLHINEGALSLMFKCYKTVLPQIDGYLNEFGYINMHRLASFLEELSKLEHRFFETENSDVKPTKNKNSQHMSKNKGDSLSLSLTPYQIQLFHQIRENLIDGVKETKSVEISDAVSSDDKLFLSELSNSLMLNCTISDSGKSTITRIESTERETSMKSESKHKQLVCEIKKWEKLVANGSSGDDDLDTNYEKRFDAWKNTYYLTKFNFNLNDNEQLQAMVENYIQGLQWVLHYYYHGVASWAWFYKYHYSPKLSDINKGLQADLNFSLEEPFKPFQQLMGVLPERSKKLIPEAFRPLMTEATSPIIDFYPHSFELDMNGKKQDWEAVVKIPFIEEDRLLNAMATREALLTAEERKRNAFGPCLTFSYCPGIDINYPSSFPGVFPDLIHAHCKADIFDLPSVDGLELLVGLTEGALLGEDALAGFPSFKTLAHSAQILKHGVNVFQQESHNESVIISIDQEEAPPKSEVVANQLIGDEIYIGWPFLQEAMVVEISDELFRYHFSPSGARQQIIATPHTPSEIQEWQRRADQITRAYSKRMGVVLGNINIQVHVNVLKGLSLKDDGSRVKQYEKIEGIQSHYALQSIVEEVINKDERFVESGPINIQEGYPVGSHAFFLGEFSYGRALEVLSHTDQRIDIRVLYERQKEPDFGIHVVNQIAREERYFPSFVVSKAVGMHPLVLSKILSSFTVTSENQKVNLGLNLKFEAKKQKVLGYSQRNINGWEFSQKAVDLVNSYKTAFPEFFKSLEAKKNADNYQISDFYPPNQVQKLNEMKAWLKAQSVQDFIKVPLDSVQLGRDSVLRIEQLANTHVSKSEPPVPKVLKGVPRNALLKPADCEHRLHSQVFALGERVICVSEAGKVPLGLRGTVVGISRAGMASAIDVVFDMPFLSGTTLGGRCSEHRGMNVSSTTVLNQTTPQVVASSKASQTKQAPRQRGSNFVNAWQRGRGDRGKQPARRPLRGVMIPPPPELTTQRGRPMRGVHRGGRVAIHAARGSTTQRGRAQAPQNSKAMRGQMPNYGRGRATQQQQQQQNGIVN